MPAPTVPHRAVEPAQITPTPPAPAQRILAAGICFMCPGGNPTDRREFSRISSAAIRDARRAHPAYTENQPKSTHLSPQRGVFDFLIFNYVVLTTEFGANSPNSPSRRFFPSVPVSSARSLTRVAVTQRHGYTADTLRASLTAKGCFRRFDFQLRCFNNGIRRRFAEFPYLRRARQHRNLKFRCFNNVNNFANRKCTHISGRAASNRGTHPQACRITSDPALVSLSCLHANASTFFLAPSNRTPPNRIPLKPSAPPSPLRTAPPSRHKSHSTP